MKARTKISVSEAAAALGVSRQRIHQLLAAGRIKGAEQVGADGRWAIPAVIKLKAGKKPGRPRKRRSN